MQNRAPINYFLAWPTTGYAPAGNWPPTVSTSQTRFRWLLVDQVATEPQTANADCSPSCKTATAAAIDWKSSLLFGWAQIKYSPILAAMAWTREPTANRCVFHGLDQNVLVRNNLEGHSQLRWMESRLILSACQIGIQIEILSIWTWFRDVHAHIEYRVFANISSLYNANGGKLVFQRQSPSFVNFRIINMLYWGKTLINFSLVCCWFACGQGKFGPKSPNWSHKWNENTFCHFD